MFSGQLTTIVGHRSETDNASRKSCDLHRNSSRLEIKRQNLEMDRLHIIVFTPERDAYAIGFY